VVLFLFLSILFELVWSFVNNDNCYAYVMILVTGFQLMGNLFGVKKNLI
jgi:hypothetical protein